jgi:hypothetical protein
MVILQQGGKRMSKQVAQHYYDSVEDINKLRARIRYLTACLEVVEQYVPLEVLEALETQFDKGENE